MSERIGNACGCGHTKAYHKQGSCIAVTDLYQCGCAGYVRNYLVVTGERVNSPMPTPQKAQIG